MSEEKQIVMTEGEFKQLSEKLGKDASDKIAELFTKAEQGNATALAEVKKMVGEISQIEGKNIAEYVKLTQEHANKLEAEIKALTTKGATPSDNLLIDIEKAMPQFKQSFSTRQSMELKTVGDITITDNLGAGVVKPLYLEGITGVPKRRTALYDLLNKVPWAGDTVHYVENSGGEGTIAARVESATSLSSNRDAYSKFAQKDYDFVKRTMTLSKVPALAKVSVEMMENASNVVSFIKNELLLDVLIKLETDILTGDGDTTIGTMKGLQHADHYTAAAVPGDYTLPSGITPSEIHALRAIVTQSLNAYMNPSVILMHPTDMMKLDLAVDKNGQFLLAPFSNRENSSISGVPVYPFAGLTAGTFHVIDGTRVSLFIQRGLNLRMWDQYGYDAAYDLMTMTASVKAGVLVKYNHKAANIYGNFATIIAAMTAGS